MNTDDTIQMDIATVLCPICPWSINLHRPTGLGRQVPEFDLYSQRKMDDALVEVDVLLGDPAGDVLFAAALTLLVVVRHRANIAAAFRRD